MLNTDKPDSIKGHHVKVDPAGRIIVPADIRSLHNIQAGDTLIVRSSNSGLELRTYDQVIREAQDRFCAAAPADRLLSNELIDERRREAEAE